MRNLSTTSSSIYLQYPAEQKLAELVYLLQSLFGFVLFLLARLLLYLYDRLWWGLSVYVTDIY